MEKVKDQLRKVMLLMVDLSNTFDPLQKKNGEFFDTVNQHFTRVLTMKKCSECANLAFKEIFQEFDTFIEDEIIIEFYYRQKAAGKPVMVEHLTKEIYGWTEEEVEEIKDRNRRDVVGEIKKMAEQPYFTLDMLLKLHEISCRNLIPRKFSKLRDDKKNVPTFKKRIGLLAEDVKPEMEKFFDSVETLIDKRALGMSQTIFETAVAKLRFDLMKIHPFVDGNTRTSMLFWEVMMAREGYEPSEERTLDYYDLAKKALGNNYVALSLVGINYHTLGMLPGYYKGETTKAKKDLYNQVLKAILDKRRKTKM